MQRGKYFESRTERHASTPGSSVGTVYVFREGFLHVAPFEPSVSLESTLRKMWVGPEAALGQNLDSGLRETPM